ncbi:GNAT family N-acetyltransferase [Streptomyces desertarenae]|uniref:GNAT family N-acetyltransferase n=1 Tax=Streptomyces desertarenae TaxID=2666184 RepID=A0ABW4PF35_9ACTN
MTTRTRPFVRPCRPEDRDAVYDVCVRTADAGGDARGTYRDPDLMGDLFAGPYLWLEPELAFVLDDGERAVGYAVGTADTAAFAEAFRRTWLPRVAGRYPRAQTPRTPDDHMIELLYTPERMVLPELADHPAHLHIDILPGHQRAGHGTELMGELLAALHRAGAERVHLGMLTANTGARRFYDRLGFRELAVRDPGPLTYLGRPTGALPHHGDHRGAGAA